MSEKQVEIKLLESDAKLLKRFLGMTDTEDVEKLCRVYSIESEAYKIDNVLFEIYKQLSEI